MSDEKNSVPTNQDIVTDLTKELESQFVITDETIENGESNLEGKADEIGFNEDESYSDRSDNEQGGTSLPDDFIDEKLLEQSQSALTDEEIETKRKEALDLKNKGNEEFKSKHYLESVRTYSDGLRTCPLKYEQDRAILYANRAASKIQLDRKESALDDCTKAVELNPNYVRAYLRRAKLYEELDKLDESLADYNKVLEFDLANKEARDACSRLPPLIEERNEKLKTEMLGKLKDLGNMILKPFGLSTENFQLQKDPNSGGYSVNFQQNQQK